MPTQLACFLVNWIGGVLQFTQPTSSLKARLDPKSSFRNENPANREFFGESSGFRGGVWPECQRHKVKRPGGNPTGSRGTSLKYLIFWNAVFWRWSWWREWHRSGTPTWPPYWWSEAVGQKPNCLLCQASGHTLTTILWQHNTLTIILCNTLTTKQDKNTLQYFDKNILPMPYIAFCKNGKS